MADVYSYGMTCYEVLTGGKPFEGHPQSDYSWVLGGNRPKLPNYSDPSTQALLAQCWHDDPSQRPTFESIEKQLEPWTSVKTWMVGCKAGRTISFQVSRNISCMLLGRHSSYELEF
jgi:serine/threonine protein kinase